MRGFPVLALMIFVSSAAVAQTMATPAAPAPSASAPVGLSRDAYIQHAQERAAKSAAKRFDAMDADHNGILTDDEIATFRAAHSRKKPAQSQ